MDFYEIANKIRLLHRLATTAADKARAATYENPQETISELVDFAEIIEESADALRVMADRYEETA